MAMRTAQPLLLGQAFRWHAGHTQQLELGLLRYKRLPVARDSRGGYPALHAVGAREEQRFGIPWSELVAQTLVGGTNRSGKTRLLQVMTSGILRHPGALVILDPVGDRELLVHVAHEAAVHGRPWHLLSLASPEHSVTMNPLNTAQTTAEVSARIHALMPSGGARVNDPFFEQYALALIRRLAAAMQQMHVPWTLQNLYGVAVLPDIFEHLLQQYLLLLGHTARTLPKQVESYRKHGPRDMLAEGLIADWKHPRDHFVKIISSLTPAFDPVIGAPLGPLFSPQTPDVTWDMLLQEQGVLYISLASMLYDTVAHGIGRVLLQDLVGYLGNRRAHEDMTTALPLTVIIDEFADVGYPMFVNALNKGGGAEARFILGMQSLADPMTAMGRDYAQRLLDNLNTKIWFRLADDETAEHATKGLGVCTVELPEPPRLGLGFAGVGGLTGHVTNGMRVETTPLIRPEWLTALPRGHAFVRTQGELWKLRVPLFHPLPEATREALGLNGFWHQMAPTTAIP